jgi:hypothetical protein
MVDLALMLAGIAPETVSYSIHFSESTVEKPGDIIDRVLKLFNNGYGTGMGFVWKPLITWKRAIQLVSDYASISNIDAEYELITSMVDSAPNPQDMIDRLKTQGADVGRALGKTYGVVKPDHKQPYGTPREKSTSAPGKGAANAGNVRTAAGATAGNGSMAAPYGSMYGEPGPQEEY